MSDSVWAPKWSPKWSQNRSKIGSQRVYNLVVFFFIFLEVLELFRCLLGAFWGFRASLGRPLDSKNLEKMKLFWWFLESHLFAS